jgi:hypothetical protein
MNRRGGGGDILVMNKRGRWPPDRVASRDQHGEHEELVDGRSFMMEEWRIDRPAAMKCKKLVGREETLISGSIYYVINSTCIHMGIRGPNIYIYMKVKYTKNPWRNTIIIKANIHLT